MNKFLEIFQIIISIFLITTILLQQRGSSLGTAFGGTGESFFKRRGMEKTLFIASIVFGFLFIINSILILVL